MHHRNRNRRGLVGALSELRDRHLPNLDLRSAATLGLLGVGAYYFFTYDPLEGYLDEDESRPTDDELEEALGSRTRTSPSAAKKRVTKQHRRAPTRPVDDLLGEIECEDVDEEDSDIGDDLGSRLLSMLLGSG